MLIGGIDYSINSPGICIYSTDTEFCFNNCQFYLNLFKPTKIDKAMKGKIDNIIYNFQDTNYQSNIERYYNLAKYTLNAVKDTDIVLLEDYALGAHGKTFNIAEATGILKFLLFQENINLILVPPTQSKKIFTGKGNANKEKMICQFNQVNNINVQNILGFSDNFIGSPVSDIVDCYSLVNFYLKNFTG